MQSKLIVFQLIILPLWQNKQQTTLQPSPASTLIVNFILDLPRETINRNKLRFLIEKKIAVG